MNQRAATGRDNRRKAIIAVAREMFLDQGYETVSMSGIAAQLGGSKTTLWSYFPNKPALFMAVAEDLIEEYAEFIQGALGFDLPLEAALGRFGRQLLAALMSPPLTALMRIVTGEARAVPGLGAMFHEQGLVRGWRITASYFAELQANGHLRADADPLRAAQHFIALCQSGCYQVHMADGSGAPGESAIAADVEAAVGVFCLAYGARAQPSAVRAAGGPAVP